MYKKSLMILIILLFSSSLWATEVQLSKEDLSMNQYYNNIAIEIAVSGEDFANYFLKFIEAEIAALDVYINLHQDLIRLFRSIKDEAELKSQKIKILDSYDKQLSEKDLKSESAQDAIRLYLNKLDPAEPEFEKWGTKLLLDFLIYRPNFKIGKELLGLDFEDTKKQLRQIIKDRAGLLRLVDDINARLKEIPHYSDNSDTEEDDYND